MGRVLPRIALGAMLTVLVSAIALVAATSPASARLPRCTDFTVDYGDSNDIQLPSTSSGNVDCVLRRGDRGGAVIVLQTLIDCSGGDDLLGERLMRDGIFGRKTERALRLVQADRGIKADGIYGPQTRDLTSWPVWPNVWVSSRFVGESRACPGLSSSPSAGPAGDTCPPAEPKPGSSDENPCKRRIRGADGGRHAVA